MLPEEFSVHGWRVSGLPSTVTVKVPSSLYDSARASTPVPVNV